MFWQVPAHKNVHAHFTPQHVADLWIHKILWFPMFSMFNNISSIIITKWIVKSTKYHLPFVLLWNVSGVLYYQIGNIRVSKVWLSREGEQVSGPVTGPKLAERGLKTCTSHTLYWFYIYIGLFYYIKDILADNSGEYTKQKFISIIVTFLVYGFFINWFFILQSRMFFSG